MAKYIISILAFTAYAGVCEYIYLCHITQVWCPGQKTEVAAIDTTLTDPIIFDWSKAQPETTAFFDDYKKKILESNLKDSILEITGYFTSEELGGDDNKELGFERARLIRALFPEIPDSLISLNQLRVNEYPNDPGRPFAAAKLMWKPKPTKAPANVPEAEITIEQVLPDREVINFPYKSSDRIKSETLETYLKNLAAQLISSVDQLTLTGFTDNIGSDEYNMNLSLQRTQDIKALLVQYGVPETQIKTVGKGRKGPVGDNNTEEGRARNRRVEVDRIRKPVQ